MMRYVSKLAVSGFLTVAWTLSPIGLVEILAAKRHGNERVYKQATFKMKTDDRYTFVIDKQGRMATLKAYLSDRASIRGGRNQSMRSVSLEPGSVWTIKLVYPRDREGDPAIVDMRKIRERPPQ